MKIPTMSNDTVRSWGQISADSSWTATENCYLAFTSVGNDSDGHAYVDVNGIHAGGIVRGSVAVGWVSRYAFIVLLAKGDRVDFKVSGGKNILIDVNAYKIEWK